MENLNKYFKENLEKIQSLYEDGQIEEAYELISGEIHNTFIPNEFVEKYEVLYKTIVKNLDIRKIEDKYEKMSKPELLSQVFKNSKVNFTAFIYFITNYGSTLDVIDNLMLEKIFINKHIPNGYKLSLLEEMRSVLEEMGYGGAEFETQFFNNKTKKYFRISLNDYSSFDVSYYQSLRTLVIDKFYKQPSLIELADSVITAIYNFYFNGKPNYPIKTMADGIYNYINDVNYGNKNENNDIVKLIIKILRDENLED